MRGHNQVWILPAAMLTPSCILDQNKVGQSSAPDEIWAIAGALQDALHDRVKTHFAVPKPTEGIFQ
jgi:hypothetical protein